MKNKSTRVRKFRGYAPERAVAGEKALFAKRVGVAKGFGPRSAENALEGGEVDPLQEKVLKLGKGESNLKPGWPNEQAPLPTKEWNASDFDKWLAQNASTTATGATPPIGGVDIPPADMGAPDPGASGGGVPPVGEGGGIRGGPFQGWSPGNFSEWHSGGGPSSFNYPSFTGTTAGPGGEQLKFETTSYNVPGMGWVPQAKLNAAMASNNFWDYMNPFGGTSRGGSNTGDPTQRGVGKVVGTLTNVFVPGFGYVTGPIARWITSKIQGGMSKGDVGRAVAQAKARGVDVTTGQPEDVTGTGGTSTSGGGQDWGGLGKPMGYFPYWQPGRTGSSSYAPFTGGVWGGGGTLAGGGIHQSDIAASGVTPRSVQSVQAPSGGYSPMGFSGPSNLNWGGGWEGGDRPHFNPYFGGYSADKQAGGPGVKLRAKGDSDLTKRNTDTVPAMLTPREAVLNRNAAELAGRGNIEQLNAQGNKLAEKGVDLAGGKNMKDKAKKYQGGGANVPQATKAGLQKLQNQDVPLNPAAYQQQKDAGAMPFGGANPPQQPYGQGGGLSSLNQAQMNFARTQGKLPTGFGGGGLTQAQQNYMRLYGNRARGNFYPPGQGIGLQGGTEEVPPGAIGSPNPQHAYGPPITLSAPQLQQAAQKAGLSAGQIQGLMSAVQGFGGMGGGGMATYGEGSATSQALGPALEQAFPGGYQGGISDIGYPPFVAPQAEYHADKGSSWIGQYDPNFMIPRY